ncbi:bifunctional molybdenum cofactor biosynthesis protein MoaC/MoaB [Xanthocytophaga flava]|uniref:bifunctional molybdenum cofactor biosynthesis protein MoaC/MoaB n=1 Tax=Xanthocytophaga flava TaxID=3048013 RepID=UPI0028D90625|nr:bifunctional molybdenum cofactor biosynthesis protein MoaC/MoaB [Xanthocytophaga flavus]MDJ1468732.1 bifunctional molybdenum cofactor biosynthesis protein MoaC/MoaB [Xanthocytophaga flavus]
MRDISSKQISLRTAKATGVVLCSQETLNLVKADKLPKGNLFDIAKAAGFLAAKNTHNLIPHCHPVSIDGMTITYDYLDNTNQPEEFRDLQGCYGVIVYCEGKSIGRTGIEMEVLTAVSVAALTIYDLLKPLDDTEIEITSVKLLKKTGGKSDRKKFIHKNTAAVLVCSDTTASGKREDLSGLKIKEILAGFDVETIDYQIVPDDVQQIKAKLQQWVGQQVPFIFTTGGTGFGPKDCTVEAAKAIIEREAIGISEAIRVHGQMRTPTAMLSRGVAGVAGKSLIITLPGSTKGVQESLDAIVPQVFHSRNMIEGEGH